MWRWPIAMLILAAACGTPQPHPAIMGHPGPTTTATSNKDRAEHDAARLLALARVPPGATGLGTPPAALDSPAMGAPNARSVVVRTRFWQVDKPVKQTIAWLRAHPPVGLSHDGSSTGSANAGFGYSAPATPALTSRELQIAVASLSSGQTAIRADGVAIWLDPTPYKDNSPGRRMRVTIAGGCPRADAKIAGVRNSGPDLSRALLPAAPPSAGLVCSYFGMDGRPYLLKTRKPLDDRAAGRLATAVRRVPLAHVDGAFVNCPMDDASVDVLVLSYPHRADIDLWFARRGCSWIANGTISAAAGGLDDGMRP